MRIFLFEHIWMLSAKSRQARHESFHPRKTLIVGRNHTGKSSLIKTMFLTIGARPSGELSRWDDSTLSLVQFSIDGLKFSVLHQRGNRALFDERGDLLAATRNHAEWSERFAAITGFNLVVTDKEDMPVRADPRCFFLPFYVNQDGSWQAHWDTFVGIQQYRAPMGSILEYFTGIKPPEYYEIKAKREIEQGALEGFQSEEKFLARARDRFVKSVNFSGPKLDPENFELEIARLTAEVTELNQKQELLREKAVRERELLEDIVLQIRLAEDALRTYKSDAKFLRSEPQDKLVCPTCRAEHLDAFVDLLTYAEDARILRDLLIRMNEDVQHSRQQVKKTEGELSSLRRNYGKISEILNTRRGEIEFRQIVDSAGAESAFRAFEEEAAMLKKAIETHLGEIAILNTRMNKLSDKYRSKEILDRFRNAYAASTHSLNLPIISTSRLKLTNRPNVSGSGGPRSILAYYAALWETCYGPKGTFAIPLVIDAPNQQGQDDINLPKVLSFIAQNLPATAQVIVSSEIGTEQSFDKTILLDEPYALLNEKDFSSIESLLGPYEKAMYGRLLQEVAGPS